MRSWSVAVSVYLLAVLHRTSLGVAGLQAADRFGIPPGRLSLFVLLQIGVYAAMQIPTGVLVDRYGPRRLLVLAAMLMGLAQAGFAVADGFGAALAARALLGLGDALTFVSVLRLAASHFSPRRYPVIVSVTGMVGTVGNLAATLPLSSLLRHVGWTPTFFGAGMLSVISGVAVYLMLPRAAPIAPASLSRARLRAAARTIAARVATAWSMPGTRVGFWVHFSAMSTAMMFAMLWGVPFMQQSQGMSRAAASTLLLTNVFVSVVTGPLVGVVISRHPPARVPIALGVCLLTALGWLTCLALFDGPMPRAVLVGLVVLTGLGAPVSSIGFAVARDYNGPAVIGTATGVVNVGGFSATIVASMLFGWALGLFGSSGGGYRSAFAIGVLVQVAGLTQMARWWLRARQAVLRSAEAGQPAPVRLTRRRWDLTG